MDELSLCLRDGRRNNKLSQQGAADAVGITRTDWIKLESGLFAYVDNNALIRIAELAHMDQNMVKAMYYSNFHSELKKRKATPSPAAKTKDQQASKSSELSDLERSLMTLPEDKRSTLLHMMQMLVQAFTTGKSAA